MTDTEGLGTLSGTETPAAVPTEGAPAPTADETPAAEPTLYDLPDGRKVDAETLQKEWKDNFLPDYTRKSQTLAELERSNKNINRPNEEKPKWQNPDYVPQTYAEIIEIAKAQALADIDSRETQKVEKLKAIETEIGSQISEIKKEDPKLDENALFLHANKYGFTDLKAAYTNMRDIKNVALDTEKRVLGNLKTRENPVNVGAGKVEKSEGYDPVEMGQYRSAQEYLQRIKQ
jgi:hypothetical protein